MAGDRKIVINTRSDAGEQTFADRTRVEFCFRYPDRIFNRIQCWFDQNSGRLVVQGDGKLSIIPIASNRFEVELITGDS